MKHIYIVLLILIPIITYSQEKIAINFQKNTPGDYELLIQKILNLNGYQTSINYLNHDKSKEGYTIEYYIGNWMKYTFELYQNGKLINSVSKKPISGINPNIFRKSLSKLLNRKLKINDSTWKPLYTTFGISFSIFKLDSINYLIIAQGSGIYSAKGVEEAFIEQGKQFSEGFEYYCEREKYYYTDNFNYSHKANRVIGIIIKNNLKQIVKLDKLPSHLKLR